MKDIATIEINCTSNCILLSANQINVDIKTKEPFPVKIYKSMLIGWLITPLISKMMDQSKEELMDFYLKKGEK